MQRRTTTITAAATIALAATLTACSTTQADPAPLEQPETTTAPAPEPAEPTEHDVIHHEPADAPVERAPFTGQLDPDETTMILTLVWADMDQSDQSDLCWGWNNLGSSWSLSNLRDGLGDDLDIDTPAAIDFFDSVC